MPNSSSSQNMKSLFLIFIAIADARFTIEYPGTQDLNDSKQNTWPCGGLNDAFMYNRSAFPLAGGPIQISTTTRQSLLQVVMAVGNEPGNNFNITAVPMFYQFGMGHFCISSVVPPLDLDLVVGSNATLQVISTGGGDGDLYGVRLFSVDVS